MVGLKGGQTESGFTMRARILLKRGAQSWTRVQDIERQNWTYGVTIHYDCAAGLFDCWSAEARSRASPDWIPTASPKAVRTLISTGNAWRFSCLFGFDVHHFLRGCF